MLKRLTILGFALLSITFVTSSAAIAQQDLAIKYEGINPSDNYRYTFKRLREKITLAVLSISPTRKANYYEKLLASRLAELKYVVDHKDPANIQTASQRYSATAGQLTEFIIEKSLNKRRSRVKQLLSAHLSAVEKFKEAYDDTTAEWRFIEYDVDYLETYISQLSN